MQQSGIHGSGIPVAYGSHGIPPWTLIRSGRAAARSTRQEHDVWRTGNDRLQ
jgi:hypothetical protein